MIAVINYGVGNLGSLSNSLAFVGAEHVVTGDPERIMAADKLILPGVGAFRDAIGRLNKTGLGRLVIERARAGAPVMGICLGMQLLFEKSREYGEHQGLGLLTGEICQIREDLRVPLKVPHIGWNALDIHRESPLTKGIHPGDCVYYVHSYYAKGIGDALVASSEYGIQIPGLVQRGNVMGAQFHPEKSGGVGLTILRAFAESEAF